MSQAQPKSAMSASTNNNNRDNRVIHERGDSDSNLEALFAILKNKDNPALSPSMGIPMSERKLPASFFTPPTPRSTHSREGSTDSTTPMGHGPIAHARSLSSPAQLPHTFSTLPTPTHIKQASMGDYVDDGSILPPGWEMAKTPEGQRYFLNHHDQTTTWIDPRKSLSNSSLNAVQQTHLPPPIGISSQQSVSPNVSLQNLGPLPPGWEQSSTPAGEVYYINHNDRTTSWFDPRLLGLKCVADLRDGRLPPAMPEAKHHSMKIPVQQQLNIQSPPSQPQQQSPQQQSAQQQQQQQQSSQQPPTQTASPPQNNTTNQRTPPAHPNATPPRKTAPAPSEKQVLLQLQRLKKKKVPTATLR